ncbi:SDR family NAD(P)-dependent oxidoreductase [Saccharopolyspora rhizosphaerae]|uniref:SDR family NAD(P)-dependent oxidoreductase n=1 Tax=Saccharopolyspora rhizosphaerae TaxID=2492662 RepID=A0A3R8NZZ4_9PSEU|nr:SDR family NAD(P)-dependent oxidoreductase [Saccharopolyspora rhizosphaerae]RRO16943.1 SDR family NAD(P)-dependent oxidoreductase [Saccharopolyspora rhizosphaerae]
MAKPLALVTGASTGIGRELARCLAQDGYDLLLTAENTQLADTAREMRVVGADVETLQVDLAERGGVEELAGRAAVTGRPLAVLALNAGVGVGGPFTGDDTTLDEQLRVVDLNVRATVHLAKLLLPGMVEQGRGRVLFTSSIAATAPGPFMAVYNASKAFVQSFAQALRDELRDTGVTVTTLLPGPTDTEFFNRARMRDTKIGAGPKDRAATVARQGYAAMVRGRDSVVAGSSANRVQVALSRVLPERLVAAVHRRMSAPGTARS